jgi:hypothetical protein
MQKITTAVAITKLDGLVSIQAKHEELLIYGKADSDCIAAFGGRGEPIKTGDLLTILIDALLAPSPYWLARRNVFPFPGCARTVGKVVGEHHPGLSG